MTQLDFLKGFIKSLAEARGDISKGSLMHCHAKGLHSIVLLEKPMIRLFVTDSKHSLGVRDLDEIPTTIAFHPHHCDLTLTTIRGEFWNHTLDVSTPHGNGYVAERRLTLFNWESKIGGGDGKFIKGNSPYYGPKEGFIINRTYHRLGSSIFMSAHELHTVYVRPGHRAAWLVVEGKEDPNFKPIAFSRQDLTKFDSNDLYKPMSEKQAQKLLNWTLGY